MDANRVCASPVLSTKDLEIRKDRDLTEIVTRFLAVGEGVIGHWVEYARGLLLFVMAPGDERSGEFYVYDRKKGAFGFWPWRTAFSGDTRSARCDRRSGSSGCWTSPRIQRVSQRWNSRTTRFEIATNRCKELICRNCSRHRRRWRSSMPAGS